jgi:hypothetical protein
MYMKTRFMVPLFAAALWCGLSSGRAQIGTGWTSWSPSHTVQERGTGSISGNTFTIGSASDGDQRAEWRYETTTSGRSQFEGIVRVNSLGGDRISLCQCFKVSGPNSMLAIKKPGVLYQVHGGDELGNLSIGATIRVNTIINTSNGNCTIYLNGTEKNTVSEGAGEYYHKLGCYRTGSGSGPASVTWTDIRFWRSGGSGGGAVSIPEFNPPAGTYPSPQTVAITSATAGATIHYTTDGSAPSATTGTVYTSPITISTNTTVRAIATASGLSNSTVESAAYTITGGTTGTAWEAESLTRTTSGATATTDTDAAASGGARVTLNATAAASWVQFALPNIAAGTYSVQLAYKTNANRGILALAIDGLQIGSTLDQYASTSSYPAQTFGNVTFASAGTHTLRLTVTGKNAASSSFTLSADRIVLTPAAPPTSAAAPTFSPTGGPFTTPVSVTMSSTTSGATIRYTTDGSVPTATTGTVYTGPVTLSATTTLKAIATAPGFTPSPTTSATYVFGGGSPLSFEAESLARTTSGVTATNDADTAASGGSRVTLNATSTGSWVEFTLPNVPAGTYLVQMSAKYHTNRGIHNLRLDGVDQAGTWDQYVSSPTYPTETLGTFTFGSAGNHLVRIQVTAKNAASSSYTLSADKFTLTPQ